MQRIGILGGTFDPIHYGHLAIAEEACWACQLDFAFLIPTAGQPLKAARHSATGTQRLDMVRLACAHNDRLLPADYELRHPPPSYTVDTLQEMRNTLSADTQLWFILGSDSLRTLPHWHQAERIIELAHLAVVVRPGELVDTEALEAQLPGLPARTTLIDGPRLDIASSELRQRIANGQPVRYQLPDSVMDYIQQNNLYTTQPPDTSSAHP